MQSSNKFTEMEWRLVPIACPKSFYRKQLLNLGMLTRRSCAYIINIHQPTDGLLVVAFMMIDD